MKTFPTTPLAALVLSVATTSTNVQARTYTHDVSFQSAVQTTSVSGFAGDAVTLQGAPDDHALFGITSEEHRDRPCRVAMRTESVNDSAENRLSRYVDRCGGRAGSSALEADYSDAGLNEPRIFVTGIRVCLNNPSNRVKGYQLKGRRIADAGTLHDLDSPVAASVDPADLRYPSGQRASCRSDEWQPWAECASVQQVAVGVVAHFEAGDEPRALTGVALRCRTLNRLPTAN